MKRRVFRCPFSSKRFKTGSSLSKIFKGFYYFSFHRLFWKGKKNTKKQRVKVLFFDNSLDETQEKMDFIQNIYNDFSEMALVNLEKGEVISPTLVHNIEEVEASQIKDLPIYLDFTLKDIIVVDSKEIHSLSQNLKKL